MDLLLMELLGLRLLGLVVIVVESFYAADPRLLDYPPLPVDGPVE
jgi:hypothetical protein